MFASFWCAPNARKKFANALQTKATEGGGNIGPIAVVVWLS
jgi:hypothetical protein